MSEAVLYALLEGKPHFSAAAAAVIGVEVARAVTVYFDDKLGTVRSGTTWAADVQALVLVLRPMIPTFIGIAAVNQRYSQRK
jgi:hypothetical protein